MDTDPDWLITRPLWKLSQRNQIPIPRFQAVDTGSQEPNSLSVELGFRIPIISRIMDSKAQDSGLQKQNFPDSGITITEEEDLCLKITWITVLQRNRWLLYQMGWIVDDSYIRWDECFFDAPLSEWSQLITPDLDHLKGIVPKTSREQLTLLNYGRPLYNCLLLQWKKDKVTIEYYPTKCSNRSFETRGQVTYIK